LRSRFIRSLSFAGGILLLSTASFAQVGVSVQIAPPELLTYDQPICPGDGYIWTPGYWASDTAYYWYPGHGWWLPNQGSFGRPAIGGWGGAGFIFNEGYWGPSVGFYGGIDYGFGYFGHGYEGGPWQNGHFFYNTAVNHVDGLHNVYNERVNAGASRVSFNGGNGGINAGATSQEEEAVRGSHVGPLASQTQHAWAAHNDPQQRISASRAAPGVAATARPNVAAHPNDLPPIQRSTPNTGNPALDGKYQQQQDKVIEKQNQDRQNLQQRQDIQDQQLTKQNAAPAKMQQLEQQNQQQRQRMQQGHTNKCSRGSSRPEAEDLMQAGAGNLTQAF
jgi:hypothetical protein